MNNQNRWIAFTAMVAAIVIAVLVIPRNGSVKPEPHPLAPKPIEVIQAAQAVSEIAPMDEPTSSVHLPAELLASLQRLPTPVSVTKNSDESVTTVYQPELVRMTKLGHGYFDQTLAGLGGFQPKNLGMTREQAFQAQEIYSRAVANPLNIERAIVEVKPISPRESLITIPLYSRGLEEALYSELRGVLGEKIAGNIQTQLGPKIRTENGGFGEQLQEIEMKVSDGLWDILYSVALNNIITSTMRSTLKPGDASPFQIWYPLFPPLPPHP